MSHVTWSDSYSTYAYAHTEAVSEAAGWWLILSSG